MLPCRAAQRQEDQCPLRVLHLLQPSLSLSALSYLLRVMGALHSGDLSFLRFGTCFLGAMFLWLGWMEPGLGIGGYAMIARARALWRALKTRTSLSWRQL